MTASDEATQADYPSSVRAWWVAGLLFCAAIISYTDRQVLSLLVDPVRRDLAIGDTQVSLLMGAAFAMIYSVAGVPLGFLADRVSRRNLLAAGVLVWSLATIGCGLAQGFGQLFACRVLVGLGEAALAPAAVSLISDYFPPRRRATAIAVFFAGISIGIGSAILIGGGLLHAIQSGLMAQTPLAAAAPWRLVFLLVGAPGLVWVVLLFTVREPLRRQGQMAAEPTGASPRVQSVSTAGGRLSLRLAPIFAAVALASFVDNAIAAWSPSLLIREFHRPAADVGVTLGGVFMAAGALGVLAGGVGADRAARVGGWSGRLRICLVAAVLNLPALALLVSGQLDLVLAGVAVDFVMSGVVTAAGLSAILDLVPNRRRGLATSISFFLNVAVGVGVGPTAVALAESGVFGVRRGLGPPLLLVAGGAYLVVVGALWFALSRRRPAYPE